MASFTIAVASVSGSARAPRTASRAHRVAASRVPKGSPGRGSGVAARRAAAAAAATDRPVVLIDNYDSFTYNLSQVREIPEDIARRRERLKRVSERFIHHAGPRRERGPCSRHCRVSRPSSKALFDRRLFDAA
jgi:hypothetical protein